MSGGQGACKGTEHRVEEKERMKIGVVIGIKKGSDRGWRVRGESA